MPMMMKTEAGAARALVATKKETAGRLTPEQRKAHIVQVTEHEIFVNQKRNEATLRDITGKAVCAIKRALRQQGAQADGRPAIPTNWDQVFKPQLGSFMKFVLGRPDQFRVTEGSGPGFYTVENVAGNTIAQPPSWMAKAGVKGKGKGKTFSDAMKGKGKVKGKGKGKDWSKGKSGKAFAPVTPAPAPPLPRGARLLAQAAKEEVAGLEEEEVEAEQEQPDLGFEEDFPEAGDAQDETGELAADEEDVEPEEDMDEEAHALQEVQRLATSDDGGDGIDAAPPSATRHGNLISSLLAGGPRKRKF